ncbi:hypothetical protein [Planktothrix paucivesiculata]|jgi:uncharacterized membrane protein|uniref:Uncharacterized protein n=1 Tax=Planktothrix paucivesiculata PCC 9631 TaxID=671071 RepID=A0A7Z9BQI5_9CYAN|nr:hypothetical protein [Planktothrix paucivesiculata]OIP68906.1 MAG: hypothetical protein AUK43_14585 [Oscillatoriales cyanobacterium CG2_30_40_61]VXD20412.1 conserved hypothetical protein [Planktothrix paucivesiculata PCC 9631]
MFDSLNDPSVILTLAILHGVIGAIAAFVAREKGRNYSQWLIIGLIGGTPALIVALLLKPTPDNS